jgi:hypothetical protein
MFPVIAQKNGASDENFIVMAPSCIAVEEIFFVMAHKSDGNAPNRFAIDDIFLVMAQESPATVTASLIAEPAGCGRGKAGRAERPHDLRHLKVLTSGTSRQGGRVRRCA